MQRRVFLQALGGLLPLVAFPRPAPTPPPVALPPRRLTFRNGSTLTFHGAPLKSDEELRGSYHHNDDAWRYLMYDAFSECDRTTRLL